MENNSSFEEQKQNVSKIVQKSINAISLCLRDTENVVSIAIKMIEKNNPSSSDLSFLKNEYLVRIRKLSYQYSNMSESQFHETIHGNMKELNDIYKNVGTRLLQIIKSNNIMSLSKVMSNMPLLVAEMFSTLKDYAHLSVNEIAAAKQSLQKKIEHVNDVSNVQDVRKEESKTEEHADSTAAQNSPTRIVFNPGSNVSDNNNYSSGFSLNDSNQYIVQEGLWSGMSGTIMNAWKMLTFSSHVGEDGTKINPVSKALGDMTESVKTLSAQAHKTFNPELAKNNPRAFFGMCGEFFTSDAFLSTMAGLLTSITIVLLLRKAYRRIRDWLVDKYHRMFD